MYLLEYKGLLWFVPKSQEHDEFIILFSVYFGVLVAAITEGRDLQWALKRTRELGFEVSPESSPDVYKMYCSSLDLQKSSKKDEL